MTEYTTIRVTKNQRDFIAETAVKFKQDQGNFVHQCVQFVAKMKYDPYDTEEVLIVEEFKKLKNQMISFIRKQEADHIRPMHDSILEVKKLIITYKGLLQDIVSNTASSDLEPQKSDLPENAFKSPQLNDLELALQDKEERLKRAMAALQTIKKASVPGKKDVTLSISPEIFQKLVEIL